MRWLYLDGRKIPRDEFDKLDAAITINRPSLDGDSPNSYGGEVKLCGEAGSYVLRKLLPRPDGTPDIGQWDPSLDAIGPTIIQALIIDDCCPPSADDLALFPFLDGKLLFNGKILRTGIQYCEPSPGQDCCASVQITDNSNLSRAFKCLREKQIYDSDFRRNGDDPGFQGRDEYPWVPYCIDMRPQAVQYLIYIFGCVIMVLFFLMLIILAPILFLTGTGFIKVNDPFEPGHKESIFSFFGDIVKNLALWIFGCAKCHPAPFVRQYIQNVCDACGLQFDSSYFTDPTSPYYNTMLVYAPIHDGWPTIFAAEGAQQRIDYQQNDFFTKNFYNKNGLDFVDELSQHFNAQYWIENGNILKFEPMRRRTDVWFDVTQGDLSKTATVCWQYNNTPLPVGLQLSYSLDDMDMVGQEAIQLYNMLYVLNQQNDPNRGGVQNYESPYGMCRFRDDANWTSVDNTDPSAPASKAATPITDDDIRDAFTSFYNFFSGGVANASRNWMLLEKGVAAAPRLVIRSPGETSLFATAIRFHIGNNKWIYNAPLFFSNFGEINGAGNSLYEVAWKPFYDPAVIAPEFNMQGTVTIPWNCDIINSMSIDKCILVPYRGTTKLLQIDSIEIDVETIVITGHI